MKYWDYELVYVCCSFIIGFDVGCVVVSVLCEFYLIYVFELF